jgi:hypothetical protein
MHSSRLLAGAIVAFAMLGAHVAHAEDSALAVSLFEKGIADMNAKKFDTACPAFAESYRLDPKPGALFTLAVCESEAGRVTSAHTHYEAFLRLYSELPAPLKLKNQKRMQVAQEQVKLLAIEIPTVTLALPAQAPQGTRIFLDEKEIDRASLSTPNSLDPGEHVVRVSVPGRTVREMKFVLVKSEKRTLDLELPEESSIATPAPIRITDRPGVGNGWRTAAIVVGSAGLAGIIVGGVTGGIAISKKSIVDQECNGIRCTLAGKEAGDAGRMIANASTVGFALGLAGTAASAVLWFTAPREKKAALVKSSVHAPVLSVGADGVVFGIRGSF